MYDESWYNTDNAAKVFLATHNDRDTRSLRVSCTLTEPIDPALLEEALKNTIAVRSQFQVRIRRGVFWHYIEHTNAKPTVTEEHDHPCPVLYGKHYNGVLHYSVTYFRRRINVEMFHALTDGTGAMEFLNLLVLNYLKLRYPDTLNDVFVGSGASAAELASDSFSQFYDGKGKNPPSAKKAYHMRGIRLPYDQLQYLKVTLPADRLREMSKSVGAGMTAYVAARLMMSMYRDMPALKRKLPVTIAIPVNLRNYYSSETSRNFINAVNISHVFTGAETLDELARSFDVKLKEALKPESIHSRMVSYQRLERLLVLRLVPLFIKQPVIRFFAKRDSAAVSACLSNLGVIKVPERLREYICDYELFCSHQDCYISMCTFDGKLNLGITCGLRSTGVLKDFVSGFAKDGLDVSLEATEVIL
ncbi:MAG: hypothetical protein ACI4Q4_02255 [Oscillospiraceae bacterium]